MVKKSINILSPIGVALISYGAFLVVTLFPPSLYERIMGEPNLMFLDPASIGLVTACVVSFSLGVLTVNIWPIKIGSQQAHQLYRRVTIAIPLLAAITVNLISVVILVRNNPWFPYRWLVDAQGVKAKLNVDGALTEALPFLVAVTLWAWWRTLDREHFLAKPETGMRALLWIATGFACMTALMKVARYDLLPMAFALTMIVILHNAKSQGQKKTRKSFRQIIVLLSITIFLFIVVALLRSGGDWAQFVKSITGYTITSYNRLSSLIAGDLEFPYGGSGTYAWRALSHVPLLHRFADTQDLLSLPDPVTVWRSEFKAVESAGLMRDYIWVSAFGYVYSDIGKWAILYFGILGGIAGVFWLAIRKGSTFGIVMYPWLAFTVLFWFGSNFVAYPRVITFLITGAFLTGYEYVIISFNKIIKRPRGSRRLKSVNIGSAWLNELECGKEV